ncbi:Hemolysin, contains CBS domains [Quadrisphaera granulorum]|uniref:CBS domain containing-hemolysin-like protein n=1 Tax=Quadrisphaera granulorum TaxID=317664 RepID=A0A316A628_9ACTN|nr:hemolysin family protein [Quadrisphaera granulorum]PWJ52688.1 CBS domain containing-hemolysin-like protein [Quadrisphaera granulorum]SZE97510.1 Hemolysin, contains CBS domains [Quadrisphaera granulorum]
MTELLLLLTAAALVVACGGFVAAEFSLLTVDRATVERDAAAGDRRAAGTLAALRSLSTQLSGAQVGITITNLAIGFLAEPAIGNLIAPALESAGITGGAARATSVTLALALSTLFTMVFGELVPKNLAISLPYATAYRVQGFSRGFARAMAWPIRLLNGMANALLRGVFRTEPAEELASARSPEELLSLVRRSAEQGTLEEETAALVQRTLAFSDRRAVDVMTPRIRVRTLSADDDLTELVAAVHDSGRSRFPVTGTDQDDVLGVVHARQALLVPPEETGRVLLRDVMEEPALVPETLELDELLDQLKDSPLQMAVVVDEYGGFAGVVTFEDLVEEIVGEVVDEHDVVTSAVREDGEGGWLVSGLLRPDEVAARTGVQLPEHPDYETVAGLVLRELGRIPDVGEEVLVRVTTDDSDDDGVPRALPALLRVEARDGLRLDAVHLQLLSDEPAPRSTAPRSEGER